MRKNGNSSIRTATPTSRALKQNVKLHLENFPRLSRVVVFRIEGLSDGRHTIKIVNKSAAGAVLDAFRVYSRGK